MREIWPGRVSPLLKWSRLWCKELIAASSCWEQSQLVAGKQTGPSFPVLRSSSTLGENAVYSSGGFRNEAVKGSQPIKGFKSSHHWQHWELSSLGTWGVGWMVKIKPLRLCHTIGEKAEVFVHLLWWVIGCGPLPERTNKLALLICPTWKQRIFPGFWKSTNQRDTNTSSDKS